MKRATYGEEFLSKYGATSPAAPAEDQAETEQLSATHAKYINSTGTHYISNSGSDENGAYSGGQAGDQTGKEWRMRDWYNRPWTCVLRYPDQKVALTSEITSTIRRFVSSGRHSSLQRFPASM